MKSYRTKIGTALAACLLIMNGCAGTTSGNPVVTLKVGSYSSLASSWFSLITPAYAAVNSVTLCFERIRFKPDYDGESNGESADSANIDFSIGEVTLSPSGNTLGSITVPAGLYRRIEFDLNDQCASTKSVQLSNTSGSYDSSDRITIKFEGLFRAEGDSQTLTLEFDSILAQLDNVTDGAQIKSTLEGNSCKGSF